METPVPKMNLETPDMGGLVAGGLWWALYVIIAAFAVAGIILFARYAVLRLSPRRLCESCNRFYSARRTRCPFCGEAGGVEEGDSLEATHDSGT